MPTMDPAFLKAALYRPPVVLGRQLLPLCAGHVIVLDALDSPLCGDGEFSLADLAVAVWVCSRTFEECQAAVDDPGVFKDCKRWGKRVRKAYAEDEAEKFLLYWSESHDWPGLWVDEKLSQEAKAPMPYIIVARLMTECGYARGQAMNEGLAFAACVLATVSDISGHPGVSLRDPNDPRDQVHIISGPDDKKEETA